MFKRLFGFRESTFLKKMNTLMEIYAVSHHAEHTYQELLKLEGLIQTEGEYHLFCLNKASLLYDMQRFFAAREAIEDIEPLNPEFAAKLAELKTKLMGAM